MGFGSSHSLDHKCRLVGQQKVEPRMAAFDPLQTLGAYAAGAPDGDRISTMLKKKAAERPQAAFLPAVCISPRKGITRCGSDNHRRTGKFLSYNAFLGGSHHVVGCRALRLWSTGDIPTRSHLLLHRLGQLRARGLCSAARLPASDRGCEGADGNAAHVCRDVNRHLCVHRDIGAINLDGHREIVEHVLQIDVDQRWYARTATWCCAGACAGCGASSSSSVWSCRADLTRRVRTGGLVGLTAH